MARLQERDKIVKQVQKQLFIDGIFEIQAGIMGVIFGSAQIIEFWPVDVSKPYPTFRIWIPLFLMLIYVLFVLASKKFIPKIRERVTFQRTGFVDYPKDKKGTFKLRIVIVAILTFCFIFSSLLIFFTLTSTSKTERTLLSNITQTYSSVTIVVGILGLLFGTPLIFLIWGYKSGVARLYFTGVSLFILGLFLFIYAALELNSHTLPIAFALYLLGFGITELLLGIAALRRYLRDYPAINQNEE